MRKQKLCKNPCKLHLFSLKSQKRIDGQIVDTTMCFCSFKKSKSKKQNRICKNFEGPKFNQDKSISTQAFILPFQQEQFNKEKIQNQKEHLKRVKEAEQSDNIILVPKPRSSSKNCYVCNAQYEDYLEHIQSKKHKQKVNKCYFNDIILDLTHKFQQLHPKNQEINIQNVMQENQNIDISYYEGRKKIKTQYQRTQIPASPYTSFFQPFNFSFIPISANPYIQYPYVNYNYQIPYYTSSYPLIYQFHNQNTFFNTNQPFYQFFNEQNINN